tara:strand:+ start:2596 stop:3693 length:1098 start_codon:yes stop_codon:yes gene_type:complete
VITVNRSDLERKLTVITSALRSNSSFPLLGANTGGQLSFWQDSYMPIWDGLESQGEDEFTFSVDSSVFRNIVNGFKTESIDIGINPKKAVVIKSSQSQVTVPYLDGPYDEIPEKPVMQISCTVERDFLRALMKSTDFVSKTYENMGLTYSYLGNKDGQFFISGAGSIYQYAISVPFSGETLPEIIMPPEYAAVVSRLFSTNAIQVGLSENQQIIMADGPTLIATRTANETYPNTVYALSEVAGELLFTANKQKLLESFRLALQTTKDDMVGLSSSIQDYGTVGLAGLDVYVPNAVIEAELFVEADIVKDFSCTYFSLPFLIKCISAFEDDTVYVERLDKFNGAFRIGTGKEEITVLQPIRYDEPG